MADKVREGQISAAKAAAIAAEQAKKRNEEQAQEQNELKRKRSFIEQAFLMSNIDNFYNAQAMRSELANYEHIYTIDNNTKPSTFLTKLLSNGIKELFDIKPAQLSLLQPTIRLFFKEKEIPISNIEKNITRSDILEKNIFGVGIKSFEWEDLGTNPADTGFIFKASLKLFAANISEFYKKNKNGFAFIDLISQEVIREKDKKKFISNEKKNRLKIEVGWATPNNGSGLLSPELLEAIKKCKTIFYLSLTTHEIDFREDGSIFLTIDYIGAVEGFLRSSESNILYIPKTKNEELDSILENKREHLIRIKKVKAGMSAHLSKLNSDSEPNEKKPFENKESLESKLANIDKDIISLEEEMEQIKNNLILEAYSKLMNKFIDQKKLYWYTTDKAEIDWFTDFSERISASKDKEETYDGQSKTTRPSRAGSVESAANDPAAIPRDNAADRLLSANAQSIENFEKAKKNINTVSDTKLKEEDKDKIKIPFIYYGDLLETILSILKENSSEQLELSQDLNNLAVILGSVELIDSKTPSEPETKRVPLTRIPISLDTFNLWFYDKYVSKVVRTILIRDFIVNSVRDLIVHSISADPAYTKLYGSSSNSKKNNNIPRTNKISLSTFYVKKGTIPYGKGQKFLDEQTLASSALQINASRNAYPTGDTTNCLLVYNTSNDFSHLNGSYKDDTGSGIYHFYIGADRGMIKNITFSRADIQYLKEARIYDAYMNNIGNTFISEPYDATITMYGVTNYKPGMLIYIHPSINGTTAKKEDRLPIGGYFVITKVNSVIEPGSFFTTLKCTWQTFGY